MRAGPVGFDEPNHGSGHLFRRHGLPGAHQTYGIEALQQCYSCLLSEAVTALPDEGWGLEDKAAREA